MTETKQITLTGEAAKAMGGGGNTKTRRARGEGGGTTRKAKKLTIDKEDEMEGGGSTSPGTLTQLATSNPGGQVQIEKVLGNAAPITAAAAPVGKEAPAVEPGLLKGGSVANTVPVKVILKPKKKSTKVVLAPPKKPAVAPTAPVASAASHGKKTRKVSRNIKVSLPGLDKKLSKAKTIRQDAAKEKIEEVKKVLHKAGLIKADSKAPESILRQMYADFMVLKNRAL